MDPLTGVATTALVEGVKFLYQQAGEVLSAWRARRRVARHHHQTWSSREFGAMSTVRGHCRIRQARRWLTPCKNSRTWWSRSRMARWIRRRSPPARQWPGCVSCLRSLWAARSPSWASRPEPWPSPTSTWWWSGWRSGRWGARRPGQASGPSLHRHGPGARGRCGQWWCGDRRGSDLIGSGGPNLTVMQLSELDWAYVQERAAYFTGRGWVFARLDGFPRAARGVSPARRAGHGQDRGCGTVCSGRGWPAAPAPVGAAPDWAVPVAAAYFCRAGRVRPARCRSAVVGPVGRGGPGVCAGAARPPWCPRSRWGTSRSAPAILLPRVGDWGPH